MEEKYSVKQLKQMQSSLEGQRGIIDSVHEACLFYYMPEYQNESHYRNEARVSEEVQPLVPAGQDAVNKLAAGIFSNTVSMGDNFFGFRSNRDEINDSDNVRRWFTQAAKICLEQMNSSNFSMMIHETLLYYCALQTGVLYSEYREGKLSFHSFPITQCSLSEGFDGIVDTVFRKFELTAVQAFGRWGETLSEAIKKDAQDPDAMFSKHKFVHAVMPRKNRDMKKLDNINMEFASYYYEENNQGGIVEESGYTSFPYAVPRFYRTSTSPYGRGPGFACLPIMREIDRLEADIIDGVEMAIQPPVFLPAGTVFEDVDLTPAAVNFYNGLQGKLEFYQANLDIGKAEVHQERLIAHVKQLFFTDLFMMLEDRKNMTATEVSARLGEKLQVIAPVVSRLYEELFSRVITRVLDVLIFNGIIERPPEELAGEDYTVEYTTKLDAMLKALEIESMMISSSEATQILQMTQEAPELAQVIKVPELIKRIFESRQVDPDLLYSKEETEQLKADAEEAMAQQQAQQMMVDKVGQIDPMKAPEAGSMADSAGEDGLSA